MLCEEGLPPVFFPIALVKGVFGKECRRRSAEEGLKIQAEESNVRIPTYPDENSFEKPHVMDLIPYRVAGVDFRLCRSNL
ncbi:hypothetical protein L596_016724 [Steinernema carpocapsae]|uniref:Uncharacterized protein n=1 Tax=Steinernema carpocapsae TaxID=34508 RepID=A0A4U5NJS1_STECR|nr:hypothetical protein L596_016724 [Steinernema carpocapsae]